ncbi:hypothetical protein [Parachitinimonas caeni]|uniref:Lipoprotein n=1 Tax=Parachitinimonas caeni TaxID=3031301 RepID=A0ABT7E553_9NEIS|nr:hypothetical protein [Parachitinimonas caeni]MDK2126580.1 hypothetical protein [Parachitinimonas caeni]
MPKIWLGICCIPFVLACSQQKPDTHSAQCGDAQFEVKIGVGYGSDLSREYTVTAIKDGKKKEVFKGYEFFKSACLKSKKGKPIFVIDNSCSGSACLDHGFSAIDPSSLKYLVRPPSNNKTDHWNKVSALLEEPIPDMDNLPHLLCCSEKQKSDFESSLQ